MCAAKPERKADGDAIRAAVAAYSVWTGAVRALQPSTRLTAIAQSAVTAGITMTSARHDSRCVAAGRIMTATPPTTIAGRTPAPRRKSTLPVSGGAPICMRVPR